VRHWLEIRAKRAWESQPAFILCLRGWRVPAVSHCVCLPLAASQAPAPNPNRAVSFLGILLNFGPLFPYRMPVASQVVQEEKEWSFLSWYIHSFFFLK
jgi:hypothetical protein